MNDIAKVLMPVIRKIMPNILAEKLADVQPMSSEVAEKLFNVKECAKPQRFRFGELVHFFAQGWRIYNGKEFMTIEDFIIQYPDLNYDELINMTGRHLSSVWAKRLQNAREEMTCPVCGEGLLKELRDDDGFLFSECNSCEAHVTNATQQKINLERKRWVAGE